MQMNDLPSAESVILKRISLTELLCSLGSEGLKSIGLPLPRKRKFLNTVQFSPGILSIYLLLNY